MQWLTHPQSTDSHEHKLAPQTVFSVHFLYSKDDFHALIWFGVLSCLESDEAPQLFAIGSHFLLSAPSSAHPELQNQFSDFYPKPTVLIFLR